MCCRHRRFYVSVSIADHEETRNIMPSELRFTEWFNAFEAVLWMGVAGLILWRGAELTALPLRTRWVWALSFFLFGVSDVIEFFTGAWWKPPALIVFKALCVFGIVFCGMQLRRVNRVSEPDHTEGGHAADNS